MTFLFWNLQEKPLTASIVRLCEQHQVDILILAECVISQGDLLTELNTVSRPMFGFAPTPGNCERIKIYARCPAGCITAADDDLHFTVRRVMFPAREEILLAAAHLSSKGWQSEEEQKSDCQQLTKRIQAAEQRFGHSRTLLVGDLNMNPFERALAQANCLNAVMCSKVAARESRTIKGENYSFFYNPMWGHFGDRYGRPPGTYYWKSSRLENCYFWNVYDQVLLRPSLASAFSKDDLKILQSDSEESLLTDNGLPKLSDHLPIVFKLNI